MSDAEVMTTALCAARFFQGNFASARLFLKSQGYIPKMLSKGTSSTRLHRMREYFWLLFELLAQAFKAREDRQSSRRPIASAGPYLIDSFPIPVCDNIRINRCRIYRRNDPLQDTDGAFRGYIASKRRYFYGLKIHVLVTKDGLPVEVFSDSRRVE